MLTLNQSSIYSLPFSSPKFIFLTPSLEEEGIESREQTSAMSVIRQIY